MNNDHDTRVTWLSMIKDSLSLIDRDELINPESEVDESSETILGVAPLEDQRLFTYAEKLEEQATRMLVDARYNREGSEEREKLIRKSFELTEKSIMVRNMLFMNLKDRFDCWSPHLFIGLRKDYIVVSGRRGMDNVSKG